jgi:hypothetical protein
VAKKLKKYVVAVTFTVPEGSTTVKDILSAWREEADLAADNSKLGGNCKVRKVTVVSID